MFVFKFFKEVIYLLQEDRFKVPVFILYFLVLSLIEVIGLGLIVPYVSLVADVSIVNSFFSQVIDYFDLPREKRQLLLLLGFVLLVTFAIKTVLHIGINAIIISFSQKQRVRQVLFLIRSYQSLSYTNFLQKNTSELIYNIQSLTTQFANTLILLLRTISDMIVGVVIFLFLAWHNPIVLLILILLFGVTLIIYDKVFKLKIVQYGKNGNEASDSLIRGVTESMLGFKEVKVLGRESYFYNMIDKAVNKHASNVVKHQVVSSIPRVLIELLMIVFIVLLVFFTINTDGSLQDLVPTLGLFSVAGLRVLPIVSTASNSIIQLRHSSDSIRRLLEDVQNFKKTSFSKAKNKYIRDFCIFESSMVSFSYQGSVKKTLNNVSFKISRGDCIGVIGPSGSGKTTLVDIMLGLITPDSGKISYNGVFLTSENINIWRSNVAYIPQDIFILDDTLKINITLSDKIKNDDTRIFSAMKRAGIYDLIHDLPDGLETNLGEKGMRISGGQRQRVALARAFYHDKDVIIMDESTSALDKETEREIINGISKSKGKLTFIIIAHKSSTIKHCNKIFRINNGSVSVSDHNGFS